MMGGVNIHQVEAGTKIKNGDKELTVTDANFVTKGSSIYMTPKNYEALKANTQVKVQA